MTDLPPIANFISNCLLLLLFITFIYALCLRFANDATLFDRTILPPSDPLRLTYYVEPSASLDDQLLFPSIFDPPELYVTFVIPAHNEETGLPELLDNTLAYLESRYARDQKFTWEIIVVDDGSTDKTADIILGYGRQNSRIRLLRQNQKMGKGAAVQAGCLHSRGTMILALDADGSTRIDEFGELERKLRILQEENPEAVVIGSRAHLGGSPKDEERKLRVLWETVFRKLVIVAGVKGIADTQCGFKLFSRQAAMWIFPNQHITSSSFDAELLLIARKRAMALAEIPIEWHEVEEGQLGPAMMIVMLLDVVRMGLFHFGGFWTVRMRSEVKKNNKAENLQI
jgi:dolichyl-phosphate beta-glucosyltransferase